MHDHVEWGVLEKLRFEHAEPFYVDTLPDHLVGVSFREFCEGGRWVLTLVWDGDDEDRMRWSPHKLKITPT